MAGYICSNTSQKDTYVCLLGLYSYIYVLRTLYSLNSELFIYLDRGIDPSILGTKTVADATSETARIRKVIK